MLRDGAGKNWTAHIISVVPGSNPIFCAGADLDGDRDVDLVVADFGGNTIRWSVWCSPAVSLCFQKNISFKKNNDFYLNGPNLLSIQGTINEIGILDPIAFWWVL